MNFNSKDLYTLSKSKDNNFNFIRIFAALSVVFSHCFGLFYADMGAEPLVSSLGFSLGTLSVYIFFVLSGFLITRSLLQTKSYVQFWVNRILRIFPALAFVIFITVFLLGPLVTSSDLHVYFFDTETLRYWAKNTLVFKGIEYDLIGVFENNPVPNLVNTPLWTLEMELNLYFLLFALFAFLSLINNIFRIKFLFEISIISLLVISLMSILGLEMNDVWNSIGVGFWYAYYFFAGALFYIFSKKVKVSWPTWVLLTFLLTVCFFFAESLVLVFKLILPLWVIYFAFLFTGIFRLLTPSGDYSYGIYIASFPIQQTILFINPAINLISFILFSFISTLIFAYFSWHLLENPCLKKKHVVGQYMNKLTKIFSINHSKLRRLRS